MEGESEGGGVGGGGEGLGGRGRGGRKRSLPYTVTHRYDC